jgi:multidrug transporter EmrE-like cation transporter
MSDFAKSWVLIAAYVAASTTGLLLLKGSFNRIGAAGVPMLAFSGDAVLLAAGVMLYALSFGLWVGVLARMPLSTAFPLAIGLTLAFTTTGAALLFGERLGLLKLAGVLLIFAGCAAVSLSDK